MHLLPHLITAATITTAIGLVSHSGWSGYLVGGIFAVVILATMWLIKGPDGNYGPPSAIAYALGGAMMVIFGSILGTIAGPNPVLYCVAAIFVGFNVLNIHALKTKQHV